MSLTKEEKADLILQRANAKTRCREVHKTIIQLRELLHSYMSIHDRWRIRFEKADLRLAEDEKLVRYGPGKSKEEPTTDGLNLIVSLSKEQLLRIAKEIEGLGGEG